MMVEKEKICSLEETTVPESFPKLTMPVTSTVGNALGKSSYANITGKPSGKKVRDAMLKNGPWFIRNNSLILKKWHPDENLLKEDVSTVSGMSSFARVMIELRADVEFKDNIVMAMPKIIREGHYTCVGEKKTMKKHSQTLRGVSVSPKIGFKPQKGHRHVPKKPNTSSSSNKKEGVEPTIKVCKSNPFDVLNLVDNNEEFGKLRLLDNDGNLLVPTGIVESDSEVGVVFYETANLRISTSGKDRSDKCYSINSLLEQWRDSYPDNDDYDPFSMLNQEPNKWTRVAGSHGYMAPGVSSGWLKFKNQEFSSKSRKEFHKKFSELTKKEIKRPKALDIDEFRSIHEGIALKNLNQLCYVIYTQDDRTFTSQACNRHSGKEKVTLDDLFLLHSMDEGARVDVPWHIAKFFSDKAKGYKKKSPIVYNGLGLGELVDDLLDDEGIEATDTGVSEGQDDHGGVRRCPNMTFTNRLRSMDKRLGTLSFEVEYLTYVVSGMSEQYGQFYGEFRQMREEQ
nr:hypothetical protein [Tanacetum cinerariifolium]